MDRRNGERKSQHRQNAPRESASNPHGAGAHHAHSAAGKSGPGEKPATTGGFHKGSKPAPNARRPQPRAPQGPTARDVALDALRYVSRDGAYAAQALDRALRPEPKPSDTKPPRELRLSDVDRRLAASIFYFALENRLRIETCLAARLKDRPEREVMEILCIAAAQILFMDKIPDHAAVDEAVKQTRRARRENQTALVNAVLRGLIRDRDEGKLALPEREAEPEAYISQRYSFALPLAKRLIDAYGLDEAERIAAWSPDRRTETVRPNRMRMTDAEFETWLDANKLEWSRGIVPGAYRIANAGRLASHAGYRAGLFSIQGESSMLAALAVEAKPGMQILDACAAPGGKSCLIAEAMNGAGRVHAWDLHAHRVELIRSAARRLGLDNVRPAQRDAARFNESMAGMMDAALVDAPCSGLGVTGDKPDIKYRLTGEGIEALAEVQRGILDACAGYVRPGGLLVYSTCTILPEENGKQIDAFLARHPEFAPDEGCAWLPEALRGEWRDGRIQILPSRDGLDGFFIARLRRKAGA